MTNYDLTIGKILDLKLEQQKTLSTPAIRSNFILKMMYLMMDLIYGFQPTLPKIAVLEILARYPYWAWENGSYHKLSRLYCGRKLPKKVTVDRCLEHITLGRSAQDTEQWHLFIIEDIIRQKGISRSWTKSQMVPSLMVVGYFTMNWFLYRIKPQWSFGMNAAFESHAEHEYMKFVAEHPEWEDEPVETEYFQYYPKQKSLADLLRRIALDERDHMNESLAALDKLN